MSSINENNIFLFVVFLITEGGFGEEGIDGDILGGDEEGGGWDVGDEDLVLPPDLVSLCNKVSCLDENNGYIEGM